MTSANREHVRAESAQAAASGSQGPPSGKLLFIAPSEWIRLGVGLVVLAAGLWSYWPSVAKVVAAWGSSPDYSHGYFVLPLALWFLWSRRQTLPRGQIRLSWAGLILIAVAAVIRLGFARVYIPRLDAWTIPIWLGGLCWLLGGFRFFRWCAPSVAFLWFMVPLPANAEILLALPLQRIAAQWSAWVLQCLGQPAIVEGTTILLGEEVLEVERACSGLRAFYGIAALAVGYIMFTRAGRRMSLVLLASTLPIALLANVVRIVATGLLYQFASGEAARRFAHDFAGFAVIPLAVIAFSLVFFMTQWFARQWHEARPRAVSIAVRVVIALAILTPCVYFWHAYQENRAVAGLLSHAQALEAEQNWADAVRYLGRYVRLRPDDAEGLVRLAWAFDKWDAAAVRQDRRLKLFSDAWKAAPTKLDLGRRKAELCLQLGRFGLAVETADRLRQASDDSPEKDLRLRADAARLVALGLEGQLQSGSEPTKRTWEDAAEAFREAIALNPHDVELSIRMARIAREKLGAAGGQEADEVMQQMTRRNQELPAAWLARYQYRKAYEPAAGSDDPRAQEIESDLDRAIQLAREHPENQSTGVLLAAAQRAFRRSDDDRAKAFFRQLIAFAPNDYRGYLGLGQVALKPGTKEAREQALAIWKEGLQKTGQRELELTLRTAEVLYSLGRNEQARKQLEPLEQAIPRLPQPQRSYIQLRTVLARAEGKAQGGQYHEAVSLLRDALAGQAGNASAAAGLAPIAARGWLRLGDYYTALADPDQAASAYATAGQMQPELPRWQWKAGVARLAAGQASRAVSELKRAAGREPKDPQVWLDLARACLAEQLGRSAEQRNLASFRASLKQATDCQADPTLVALLKAGASAAEKDSDDLQGAIQQLEQATVDAPDSAPLYRALAIARQQEGDEDGAMKAAAEFTRCSERPLEGLKLRAELLARAGKLDQAIQTIESQLASFGSDDQMALRYRIVQMKLAQGDRDNAGRQLEELARARPNDLRFLQPLAQLALEDHQWDQLEAYERKLKTIEGEDGTLWRVFRARRLLRQLPRGRPLPSAVTEVTRIVREIKALRPAWPEVYVLEAELAQRQGRLQDAVVALQEAVRLGDHSVRVEQSLIGLFMQQGNISAAESYLKRFQNSMAGSRGLVELAIPIYARTGDPSRALRLAEDSVQRDPQDPENLMRLGRTILLVGKENASDAAEATMGRAEKAFRRAVELAPNDIRTWVTLFAFYSRDKNDRRAALATVRELADRIGVPPGQKAFVLAQLYQSLGLASEASSSYRKAVELASEDTMVTVLERAALYFRPFDPDTAIQYGRRVLRLAPNSPVALVTLVSLLVETGSKEDLGEAFTLLQKAKDAGAATVETRRLEYLLLLRRGKPEDRRQALTILEELVDLPGAASPRERLRLALLYEQNGRVLRAYELLDSLAKRPDATHQQLIAFIQFLQRNTTEYPQFEGQVDQVIERLEVKPGGALAALKLRIDRLKQAASDGRPGERSIHAEIDRFVRKQFPASRASTDDQTATDARSALFYATLVMLLRDEDLGREALRLCQRTPPLIGPEEIGPRLATALTIARPQSAVLALAEPILMALLDDYPTDARLMFSVGTFLESIDRTEEAIGLYRRALDVQPGRLDAMNNLAYALATRPETQEEATEIIEKAISLGGQQPWLLDTLAVVKLHTGDPQGARDLLIAALQRSATDPTIHLHLAAAYRRIGQDAPARRALQQTRALSASAPLVNPRDRRLLQELEQHYQPSR